MTADPATLADTAPLLEVRNLSVQFEVANGWLRTPATLHALRDVSLALRAGETLGVVGESGSGKSTLARAILQLVPATRGDVLLGGRALGALPAEELRALRAQMQIIFQDPRASLDPRMTVGDIVAEPLNVFRRGLDRAARERRVIEWLERVGLSGSMRNRYPHEFSGGQCQRIAIARALVLQPRLLVCDEPVSALDVSVQAQIVNLLQRLQRELGLALVFISHNLAVVRHLSNRILVLYLGRIMEIAPRTALYAQPRHPYTRALLAAIPGSHAGAAAKSSAAVEWPSALAPPSGCVFRTRCAWAVPLCAERVPVLKEEEAGRWNACHRSGEI
jgi:oligopeptide transport system ATP-binding protein